MKQEMRITLRLPGQIGRAIKREATRNGASFNAEIVRALREKVEALKQAKGKTQ